MKNDDGEFNWDEKDRWTAYKPYNSNFHPDANPSVKYTALPIDFSNQTQMGLTDMQALYQGKGGQPKAIITRSIFLQRLLRVNILLLLTLVSLQRWYGRKSA